jgi:hypothetical protein
VSFLGANSREAASQSIYYRKAPYRENIGPQTVEAHTSIRKKNKKTVEPRRRWTAGMRAGGVAFIQFLAETHTPINKKNKKNRAAHTPIRK